MKLSEAILLGSVGSEQGSGLLSIYKSSEKKCALGAALLATGLIMEQSEESLADWSYERLRMMWPWLRERASCHLCQDGFVTSRLACVWHLNDIHKWTRPQIAAWVATIEPEEDVCDQPKTATLNCLQPDCSLHK